MGRTTVDAGAQQNEKIEQRQFLFFFLAEKDHGSTGSLKLIIRPEDYGPKNNGLGKEARMYLLFQV